MLFNWKLEYQDSEDSGYTQYLSYTEFMKADHKLDYEACVILQSEKWRWEICCRCFHSYSYRLNAEFKKGGEAKDLEDGKKLAEEACTQFINKLFQLI